MRHPAEQVKKQYTEYKKGGKVKYVYRRIVPIKIPGSISPSISFGTDLFIAAGGGS